MFVKTSATRVTSAAGAIASRIGRTGAKIAAISVRIGAIGAKIAAIGDTSHVNCQRPISNFQSGWSSREFGSWKLEVGSWKLEVRSPFRATVPRVISGARYVHTNLIARDWKTLSRFYQDVFACVPVPPERNLSGRDMEAGTGVPGARLQGIHLRLPGGGSEGPTLEIFEYSEPAADVSRVVNRPGFAHIAFAVDSVSNARDEVLAHGGSPVGEIVTVAISSTAKVTWCYVRDLEGNIIELQAWT
jgi:predicted enzyme related to lactoylglutathione lyase